MENIVLSYIYLHQGLDSLDDWEIFNRISLAYNFHDIGPDKRDELMHIIHAFKQKECAPLVARLLTGGSCL